VRQGLGGVNQGTSLKRISGRLLTASSYVDKWLYASSLRSSADLHLPDFLGIGAQRAGSTWLHKNLKHHPQIYLPEPKELHYWDREFCASLTSYSEKFQPGSQQAKGEITPAYSLLPLSRIRLIRGIMPGLKLIFLMRNPIDRAWSQALMNLVDLPQRQFEDVDEGEFVAHFRAARSVKRGDYGTILDHWLSVFPEDQMYIGFFDDIVKRPRELLGEVCTYLGVSTDVDWESFPYNHVVNKGPSIPLPKQYRGFLEEMYCQEVEALYERFGTPVAAWRC
jgi:hypothetical protein